MIINKITAKINYYFWASYRRKLLDQFQKKYSDLYHGTVMDIGGRDRGNFNKPKNKVKKWIFGDINADHNPDILLNVSDMKEIAPESIDIVNAIELFEHVEKIEDGIKECFRILKKDGYLIASAPFLYPIHADPYDYQRWTKTKWEIELKKVGFEIKTIEHMGSVFTVLSDIIKTVIKSLPFILRYFLYITYPIFDIITKIDKTLFVKNNKNLIGYTTGYFLIAKK